MQKTFGFSTKDVMWKESWIALSMKMRDMPRYEYDSASGEEKDLLKGTNDILKEKFAKFIKPATE